MKKYLFLLLLILPIKIVCASYVVMDMDSNKVLFGDNIHDKRLIASTSKILTAIIAIENSDLDKEVVATKEILSAVGSSIYMEIGEKFALRDLLYGMMLRSGNDASAMIALTVSGSIDEFASLMNEYAKKIGMSDSNFINPHGLENDKGQGNISTAYDMALLTSYAYQNETFRKIFKTKEYNCQSDRKKYSWYNKNKLLKYDYITGGKTGFTIKARRALVTTANINNMNIVVVTLNDSNDFNNHLSYYNKVKNEFKRYLILSKSDFEIFDQNIYIEDKLFIKNDYFMTLKNINDIKIKYFLFNKKAYKNNDVVGIVKIYLNDEVVYMDNIYIKKERKNKVVSWFKKLFK